jgi:hypothetical protein
MKHLRWLAFLAVPTVLTLALAVPATAAPVHPAAATEAVAAHRAAAVEALHAFVATHPLPAATTNYIGNAWSGGGLGAIHQDDGTYTHGTYDALLPYNEWSDLYFGWENTAGWYTGTGFCNALLRSDDGGATWYEQLPDLGSGQHFIGPATNYIVSTYAC